MKKQITFLFLFIGTQLISISGSAQTTVAAGNWSSPATWGGMPPVGSGTVIINHAVTLDMDYAHSSGSITINSGGSLTGNSVNRGFALNYPSGVASLTVGGTFNVARTALYASGVSILGTFTADSLYNSANISVNANGTISANQFLNYTFGTLTNNGTLSSINFFNMSNVNNSGTFGANDFTNAKTFSNAASGVINITHDFSNMDTLASPAVFTNNGTVGVIHDWYNGTTINGTTGKFCVGNNSLNAGTMSGSFDFCDLSGTGNVDQNNGTIATTITHCNFSCNVGIQTISSATSYSLFPNPANSNSKLITEDNLVNATFIVYNVQGQIISSQNNLNGKSVELSKNNLTSGFYFFTLRNQNRIISGKFIYE